MKFVLGILLIVASLSNVNGSEPTEIPPEPPIEEITKKAQSASIVLTCQPTKDQRGLEVVEVLKGKQAYMQNMEMIGKLIPTSDPKALSTEGFRELVFIGPADENGAFLVASTLALWPDRREEIGPRQFLFLAHDYSQVKLAVQGQNKEAQQDGADQPTTAPQSKTEGKQKHQPESEGRPQ